GECPAIELLSSTLPGKLKAREAGKDLTLMNLIIPQVFCLGQGWPACTTTILVPKFGRLPHMPRHCENTLQWHSEVPVNSTTTAIFSCQTGGMQE
ncbi:hypothetical protein AVEN_150304-1, partial [Araneus ventricosus]